MLNSGTRAPGALNGLKSTKPLYSGSIGCCPICRLPDSCTAIISVEGSHRGGLGSKYTQLERLPSMMTRSLSLWRYFQEHLHFGSVCSLAVLYKARTGPIFHNNVRFSYRLRISDPDLHGFRVQWQIFSAAFRVLRSVPPGVFGSIYLHD